MYSKAFLWCFFCETRAGSAGPKLSLPFDMTGIALEDPASILRRFLVLDKFNVKIRLLYCPIRTTAMKKWYASDRTNTNTTSNGVAKIRKFLPWNDSGLLTILFDLSPFRLPGRRKPPGPLRFIIKYIRHNTSSLRGSTSSAWREITHSLEQQCVIWIREFPSYEFLPIEKNPRLQSTDVVLPPRWSVTSVLKIIHHSFVRFRSYGHLGSGLGQVSWSSRQYQQ